MVIIFPNRCGAHQIKRSILTFHEHLVSASKRASEHKLDR